MRYLDPKNDLTFRKVFGQHPRLLKSFLNAMLPLTVPIKDLEYLPAELVPEVPLLKYSIVDVRCIDEKGRQLPVEMRRFGLHTHPARAMAGSANLEGVVQGVGMANKVGAQGKGKKLEPVASRHRAETFQS